MVRILAAGGAIADWALASPTLDGLWHLEGRELAVLADGSVQPTATVRNGTITLPRAAGCILAGLPYACDLETLNLEVGQPIFNAFFQIRTLGNFPQAYNSGRPVFRGIYEDNDRSKRLMIVVNYNTDVSQYWEWSGRGFRPFDDTNEAYKLGVNYLMYGITH